MRPQSAEYSKKMSTGLDRIYGFTSWPYACRSCSRSALQDKRWGQRSTHNFFVYIVCVSLHYHYNSITTITPSIYHSHFLPKHSLSNTRYSRHQYMERMWFTTCWLILYTIWGKFGHLFRILCAFGKKLSKLEESRFLTSVLCVWGNDSYHFLHQKLYFVDAKVHYLWLKKGKVRKPLWIAMNKMQFYHLRSVAMLEWKSWKAFNSYTQQINKYRTTHILTIHEIFCIHIARDFEHSYQLHHCIIFQRRSSLLELLIPGN